MAGVLLVGLLLLAACGRETVYYHYETTPRLGWEKNDSLTYDTAPFMQGGLYAEDIGIRITNDFPFTQLVLVVEQTILPKGDVQRDTLVCRLIDEQGNTLGPGVDHYQYMFPLSTITLQENERLHVALWHNMKREILPGITDIGLRIDRKEP